jgi:hypothetical protein
VIDEQGPGDASRMQILPLNLADEPGDDEVSLRSDEFSEVYFGVRHRTGVSWSFRAFATFLASLPVEEKIEITARRIECVFQEQSDRIRSGHIQARGTKALRAFIYSIHQMSGKSERKLLGGFFLCHFQSSAVVGQNVTQRHPAGSVPLRSPGPSG